VRVLLTKRLFFLRLLLLNPLRLLPRGRLVLLRKLGAAPEDGVLNGAALLRLGARLYGRAGFWLAALALYAPGFLLMLAGSLRPLPLRPVLPALLGAVFCTVKFDVFRPPEPRSLLPFGYLALAACAGFFWPLTYLFLAAYVLLTCPKPGSPEGGDSLGQFL
jgi:hypothetical protein